MTKLMNKWGFAVLACAILAPMLVFAQEIVAPTGQDWLSFLTSLGGLKGASALTIAGAVVQGLMMLFKSQLGEKSGAFRLTAMSILTLISAVIAQKLAGINDIGQLLSNSAILAAGQNFLHQLYVQYFEKKS